MAFEMGIVNADTGKKERAYVSHFVFDKKGIVAIYNTKSKASQDAALTARKELDNFIKLITGMQKNDKFKEYTIGEGETVVKLKDIDISRIKKITIGPRGSKKFGFDKELEYSEEELEALSKTIRGIEKK